MPKTPIERGLWSFGLGSLFQKRLGRSTAHMQYCSVVSCKFVTSLLSVNECSVCLKACHLSPAVPSGLTKDLIFSTNLMQHGFQGANKL